MKSAYTVDFSDIRMSDVARVGGKNASLGELFTTLKPEGVGVLDGFAITTDAYWRLLEEQDLRRGLPLGVVCGSSQGRYRDCPALELPDYRRGGSADAG